MKVALLSLLMLFSSVALAEDTKEENQSWVGASTQVAEKQSATKKDAWAATDDLEMTQSWHYGLQDSDTIVNRARDDGWYDHQ